MAVPRPPENLIQVGNNVVRWWSDPCDAPVTVYMESFFQAIFPVIVEYYSFDAKSMITAFFRPARHIQQYRSGKKGKRGPKSNRPPPSGLLRKLADFDLGNEIGKRLPGARDIRARHVNFLTGQLWILEGFIERVLYWMMIVDLVKQFIYSWTSMLYQTEYCQAQSDMVLVAEGTSQSTQPLAGFVTIFCMNVLKRRGDFTFTGGALIIPQGFGTIIFGGTARQIGIPPDPEYVCTIFEFDLSELNTVAIFNANVPIGTEVSVGLAAEVKPHHTYVVAHTSNNGFVQVDGPVITFIGKNE